MQDEDAVSLERHTNNDLFAKLSDQGEKLATLTGQVNMILNIVTQTQVLTRGIEDKQYALDARIQRLEDRPGFFTQEENQVLRSVAVDWPARGRKLVELEDAIDELQDTVSGGLGTLGERLAARERMHHLTDPELALTREVLANFVPLREQSRKAAEFVESQEKLKTEQARIAVESRRAITLTVAGFGANLIIALITVTHGFGQL